jgi:poly(A) polymerase
MGGIDCLSGSKALFDAMTDREFALQVVRRLREAGHQALWAGGCVRDELLGKIPKDYDVATDAHPDQVQQLFRRSTAVGASFGVVEVLGPRAESGYLKIQVATFRSDAGYTDGRHPDQVVFSSPREDALRRDFTINGMFFDPVARQVIDYVGGQEDLRHGVLRAIGDPRERFHEDKLRMLRGVRLATTFDLKIDPATEKAIQAMASPVALSQVSAERIAEELRRLLAHPRRSRGVNLLADLGLAQIILPEILVMKDLPQGPPGAPTGNLWDHCMLVLDFLGPEVSFPLAFAGLLHDIGKPRTVGRTPDRYTFHHHEHVGKRMATEICERLKLSNAERTRVEWLVEKHQYLCDAQLMRTSKLKQILAEPEIRELLALHRADALASGNSTAHVDYCERLLEEWSNSDLNPPRLITGHDLLRLGLEPGENIAAILTAVREAQLDSVIKTPKEAMEMAQRLITELYPAK